MRSPAVVEVEMSADRGSSLRHAGVSARVALLAFDRLPEALDEDVGAPSALAIHADPDVRADQPAAGLAAGELRALVGVEDFRRSIAC